MNTNLLAAVGTFIAIAVMTLFGVGLMVARFYRKVDQGKVLINNKTKGEPLVTFTGGLVFPIIHRAEVMDISLKTVEIDRRGKEGLICRDNIRADIKVTFFVRVNKTRDDVLKVAQAIGCVRASDPKTMEELFGAKFSEALKTVGKRLDFTDLYQERDRFRDQIIEVIGKDLNGYVLEDAAIDYLEQTPLQHLDKDNILDAEGIRKVTELTTAQNVLTNDFRQNERKAIKKQNVEAEEAILALDRQQADAESKQKREILTMRAREEAETAKVQSEEKKKSELARIKTEEEVQINEQNKMRQVEVAQKNRQRVVAVENEKVEKDRALEAINRERETELSRIAKEKDVEVEKKAIADVIRGRITVDKTVAFEEEQIKDLRAQATANRDKAVLVTAAEAQAQEKLVKEIKIAEAAQQVAKFRAQEKLTMAEADLEAADKNARAKIRIAEGEQATAAAHGLAEVKVKEADAQAIEKVGFAEARVTLEKMQALASGEEKQGLAKAKVKEADAAATQKHGLAEAQVSREKLVAEAAGKEADAAAREKMGMAEANALREKLSAEASGILEKANAMKSLDGSGREHEEFRLRLEKDRTVALETIKTRKDIAAAQAGILSEAFGHAKINIVGGDGAFFDRFVRAVSLGQSLDGVVDNSDSVQHLFKDYLKGDAKLSDDLKSMFGGGPAAMIGDGVKATPATLSSVLAKMMTGVDEPVKAKLKTLITKAKDLGIDDIQS